MTGRDRRGALALREPAPPPPNTASAAAPHWAGWAPRPKAFGSTRTPRHCAATPAPASFPARPTPRSWCAASSGTCCRAGRGRHVLAAPLELVAGLTFQDPYAFLNSWVVQTLRDMGVEALWQPINDITSPTGKNRERRPDKTRRRSTSPRHHGVRSRRQGHGIGLPGRAREAARQGHRQRRQARGTPEPRRGCGASASSVNWWATSAIFMGSVRVR